MARACIDVGSNTTRLLVAESRGGRLRELMSQRSFTRIGKSIVGGGRIPKKKVRETTEVVAAQARAARDLGAEQIVVVATAAIRRAPNGRELAVAIEEQTGLPVRILSEPEEARLSFLGATRSLTAPIDGRVGVVDVGGGSTEIAIGTIAEGVCWSESFRIGSGLLADSHLHSDPPAASELSTVRQHVAGVFKGLEVPPTEMAVAVGGSATSLRRLVGAELSPETLERSLRILSSTRIEEVARRFDLDAERVKLLPAGLLIFEELSTRLGLTLQIAGGGLREGAIIEMMGSD